MIDVTNLEREGRPALKERWAEIICTPPPPRLSKGMMVRVLASELQWQASGQSSIRLRNKLQRIAGADTTHKPSVQSGARLMRTWNGREHVVDVVSDGYRWNDRTWRSLSAIAREITGTKWSGPRFFGVAA